MTQRIRLWYNATKELRKRGESGEREETHMLLDSWKGARMMKKIILCMLGCLLLLMWTEATAETCTHENLLECSFTKGWEDVEVGHQWVETRSCVCDDCGKKLIKKTYGGLVGHVFYMSESLHFAADRMHLWVFVCPDCRHVTLREESCAGGDRCLLYSAQAGERPPVQQEEAIAAFREFTTDDYIKRWIASRKTE